MNRLKYLSFIFYYLMSVYTVYPQENNPDAIIQKVLSEFEKIQDYSVNVHVKVDVSFLKIPEMDAELYFKQPDKMKIKSDNFALLPKQGFNFSPVKLLRTKHTSLFVNFDTLDNVKTAVLKVIPLEEGSDLILSTLWIDVQNYVIVKVESTTKPGGTFTITFDYSEIKPGIFLPEEMIFTFPADQMMIRKGMKNPFDSQNKESEPDSTANKVGKVTVTYSNYKVNTGIPDSIFEEENTQGK